MKQECKIHGGIPCKCMVTDEKKASPDRIKEQLDRLLSVVNAVTCPYRHGQPIRPRDLTRLTNRQIEVEEALREMGYDI